MLVLDTETTGLPPRNALPNQVNAWNGCRMVQLAWELYTSEGESVDADNFYVLPDGFTIPFSSTQIHGITPAFAVDNGVPVLDIFRKLHHVLTHVGLVVAHNMTFDDSILQAELYRLMEKHGSNVRLCRLIESILLEWTRKERVCTMRMTAEPGKKWNKLAELYQQCFGSPPTEQMHHADADVRACAKIYFHLRQKRKTNAGAEPPMPVR